MEDMMNTHNDYCHGSVGALQSAAGVSSHR